MIAGPPNIVISPTPTTGLPANSFAGASSGNPFSAALQAATQNLLHPSLKSQIMPAKPGQPNSSANNLKNPSQEITSPLQGLPVPSIPAISPVALLQPGTIDEAKLQTATLGAEQNQSTVQTARVDAATAGTHTMPTTPTNSQQFVPTPTQVGPEATAFTGSIAPARPNPQAVPPSSSLPAMPQGSAQPTLSLTSQQPKAQPAGDLDPLSAVSGKNEATPVRADAANVLSAPANQPGLSAHVTKAVSQPAAATPQAASNVAPSTNGTRPIPDQPEHSGIATDTKNQTAVAAGTSAAIASSAPQIPLQMVMPDINNMKVSSKPTQALQTPSTSGSPAANGTQPAVETFKKNADASGSGSNQSGTSKGSTSFSSFASAAANSQLADNNATPVTKTGDASASTAVVGTQVAHAVASANDAPGASARNDAHAGETLQSPVAGTADADARAQAAATYGNSLLHSARLVERMGQTELRVGIQTGEFGNVDIRTSMVRNQFTAQISVERGELGKVLAAELPSLQNKLSEQRLPMANITLQNQSSGSSAGFGQESRQSQTMQQNAIPDNPAAELTPAFVSLAEAGNSSGRLDVHM